MTKMLDPGAGGNTGTGNNTDNSTEAGDTDPCSQVSVIDKVISIIHWVQLARKQFSLAWLVCPSALNLGQSSSILFGELPSS